MCVSGWTLFAARYKAGARNAWKRVPEALKQQVKVAFADAKTSYPAVAAAAAGKACAILAIAPPHLLAALDAARAAADAAHATSHLTWHAAAHPTATATAIPTATATAATIPFAVAVAVPHYMPPRFAAMPRPFGISRSIQPDQYPTHPGLFDYNPNPLNNFYERRY